MAETKKQDLKNYLKERLATTWGVLLASLIILFFSPYLPPAFKFFLWVLFLGSIVFPIVKGILRGMKDQN